MKIPMKSWKTGPRSAPHGKIRETGDTQLVIAIICSYNLAMEVSTAEAKNRLPELIRVVEGGEQVVITRHGRPVAQLAPPPAERKKPVLGGMKGRIRFLPGWDAPISEEELLGEDH